MGSWIFGGYPSPNLLVARELSRAGARDPTRVLREVAALYYGRKNASLVVAAWAEFSDAFRNYPFSIPFQYSSPLHVGPAVEWPLRPTGQRPRMYCSSDDPAVYCQPYDPDAVRRAFERMASRWKRGLRLLEQALGRAESSHRQKAERDLGVAETVWICMRSLVNHIRFCALREKALRSRTAREQLRRLIAEETSLAARYYARLRGDSRLAFEPSMQYFVLPNDVKEKVLNLQQIRDTLDHLDRTPPSTS
jgi:hypothetical protein